MGTVELQCWANLANSDRNNAHAHMPLQKRTHLLEQKCEFPSKSNGVSNKRFLLAPFGWQIHEGGWLHAGEQKTLRHRRWLECQTSMVMACSLTDEDNENVSFDFMCIERSKTVLFVVCMLILRVLYYTKHSCHSIIWSDGFAVQLTSAISLRVAQKLMNDTFTKSAPKQTVTVFSSSVSCEPSVTIWRSLESWKDDKRIKWYKFQSVFILCAENCTELQSVMRRMRMHVSRRFFYYRQMHSSLSMCVCELSTILNPIIK